MHSRAGQDGTGGSSAKNDRVLEERFVFTSGYKNSSSAYSYSNPSNDPSLQFSAAGLRKAGLLLAAPSKEDHHRIMKKTTAPYLSRIYGHGKMKRGQSKRRLGKPRSNAGEECDEQDRKIPEDGRLSTRIKTTVNLESCGNTSKIHIRRLIRKYGWKEVPGDECTLLWTDLKAARSQASFKQLISSRAKDGKARTNHFPMMSYFVSKSRLSQTLTYFQDLFPALYDFFPPSWDLPRNMKDFKKQYDSRKTYLLKPSFGQQGEGIVMVQDWGEVIEALETHPSKQLTAQEYLDRPLLVQGYKFDFRIYVLVESLQPLTAVLFRDGLARFCCEKYRPPSRESFNDEFAHLTNYSLNKFHSDFKPAQRTQRSATTVVSGEFAQGEDDDDTTSKRSISLVLRQLRAQGVKITESGFWREVEKVVSKTLLCMWPSMWGAYSRLFSTSNSSPGLSSRGSGGEEGSMAEGVWPAHNCHSQCRHTHQGDDFPSSPDPSKCFHLLGICMHIYSLVALLYLACSEA